MDETRTFRRAHQSDCNRSSGVLAILIERLSKRDVLRNKVVLPGSFLDRCCFARPERLSFFQAPEALPPSGDVDEVTVEFVIPDRPSGKIFTKNPLSRLILFKEGYSMKFGKAYGALKNPMPRIEHREGFVLHRN